MFPGAALFQWREFYSLIMNIQMTSWICKQLYDVNNSIILCLLLLSPHGLIGFTATGQFVISVVGWAWTWHFSSFWLEWVEFELACHDLFRYDSRKNVIKTVSCHVVGCSLHLTLALTTCLTDHNPLDSIAQWNPWKQAPVYACRMKCSI